MADLNWNSRNLTHGWQKGVTAFYYGLGFDDADFNRAQIGIGTPLLTATCATCTPTSWPSRLPRAVRMPA